MLQEYNENECKQPSLDMNDDGEPEDSVQNGNSIAIQTDLSCVMIDENKIKLRYKIDEIRKKNEKLKQSVNIKDTVGLYCSKLEIPAFTKGKKQLDPISVEETRNIANVRIHVERVIGNVRKKYSILSANQPIDFVISENNAETTLDKIVHVACALINMCDSVVSFD